MLAGVRILDTTRLLPGPYATWLLRIMGAEVVKIEQPGRGDYIRSNYPRRHGTSTVFHLYNAGKCSVALNLKHDEGRAAFLDLVSTADVVLDGNRPGTLDRLGCGWSTCRELNTELVFCAITGYGQDGPYRQRVGHDINYLAHAGVLSALRDGDGRPIAPRVTIADMAGGLVAVGAALAALLAARDGAGGRFVDIAMTDTALSMSGLRLAEELFGGEQQPPGHVAGEGDDYEYGVYRTSDDRWISLDPYEVRFKDVLWNIIEREDVGTRPDRASGAGPVRAALADAICRRPRARWDALLADAEVCYAPVYEPRELLDDANVRARGLVGFDGSVRLAPPMRFDPAATHAAAADDERAPERGADTELYLLALGWSPQRIRAAAAAGAIELAK